MGSELTLFTLLDWWLWQQEEDCDGHGDVPGGVDELVVALVLQDHEAEEATAQNADPGQEEAAGVLEAGEALAVGRAVRGLETREEILLAYDTIKNNYKSRWWRLETCSSTSLDFLW